MARFNTSLPPKFPHNLDMEDAYSLLCEKNELYEKYLQNGDEAGANAMCELCVEIANHYSLMFVPHIDNTYTPPIPTEELLEANNLLVAQINIFLQAQYEAQKAKEKCAEIIKQFDMQIDIEDMYGAYEQCRHNISMLNGWYHSGCGDYNYDDYRDHLARTLGFDLPGFESDLKLGEWYGSNCSGG